MKKALFLILLSTQFLFSQKYIQTYQGFENNAGTTFQKFTYSIEFGKQYNVFSLGLNFGKIEKFSFSEIKSNLNVFEQGKFTNTLTFGLGYVINSNTNLLTELSSGIEYSNSENIHFNIQFGQYYFSGNTNSYNTTFIGVSTIYFFNHKKQKK